MNRLRTGFGGYFVAFLAVCVAVLLRRCVLDNILGQQFPFVLFLVAVVAAAWIGGLKSGLLAVGLGAAASYFFFDHRRLGDSFELGQVRLALFVVFGSLASYWLARLDEQQKRLALEMRVRQRAEHALGEREERIRMAVESADIGTWDLNVRTGERQWSDRTKAMFGLPLDEDVSKLAFVDLLHPDDRLRTRRAIQAALDPKGDGRYETEYRTVWSDGTVRWVIAKGQVFFQGARSGRQAHRFIGTVLDITERKQIEQALRDADRRKNDFLAVLAHELRNPLTPISNALQVWEATEGDGSRMEHLRDTMMRHVQQMIRLIDDLMDVGRITSGRIDLRVERLDLATVITTALESVQPLIRDRGHQLALSLPAALLFVEGDAVRLGQVFGNLLNNAAKFTDRHGVISIIAERRGDKAVVSIRDNGPGIPADMLAEIFDAYRQVHGTRERSQGGLGIGLSLVKRLTEMHGGTVTAHSEGLGTGSEFVVALPAHVSPDSPQIRDEHDSFRRFASIPRHRILIVDDLPEVAESFSTLLDVVGQEVVVAHDGPSAIEAALSQRPNVVFLDIAMPGMNGYEVARRLRARPELKGLTLVALTGFGQKEDQNKAMRAGFDHHLTKPTNMAALQELLLTVPVEEER